MNFNEYQMLIKTGKTEEFIKQTKADPSFMLSCIDAKYNWSLLDWATIYNRVEIVTFLCEYYPALLMTSSGTCSALNYAVRYNALQSLQILIAHLHNLKSNDQYLITALQLAIDCKNATCARILINQNLKLPTDITALVTLIRPFEFTLYCEPSGIYQLLTDEEIKLITATEKLSSFSLNTKNKDIKKTYILKIDAQNIENILLSLIDKYLYLYNRTFKEIREGKHGISNPEIKNRVELSKAKRESLLKVIRLIVAATNGHNPNQSLLMNDASAKDHLLQFVKIMQASKQQYFGDDLSDDSDTEENEAYLKQLSTSSNSVDEKIGEYVKNSRRQNRQFWLKTRMNTPGHAGLKQKITSTSVNIKNGFNSAYQLNNLDDAVLTKYLKERGEIEYDATHHAEAIETINRINSCPPENLAKILKSSKPIFILGTRGINYMSDRWNADARRYHRKIDERQQPQYSEAVLKTLPYDYYTELDKAHDFHHNREDEFLLQKEAVRLNGFFQSLANSGPCLGTSFNHSGSYLFNSVGDCLQDHFSNGVDNHLDDLAGKRFSAPNYWGTHLKNSFNPGIAIGSRPYHALKYTFGLKDYYPCSMQPRYWNDGTLEYSHVGKVYLSLHPLEEILSSDGPNNVSTQDRQARVCIKHFIAPEKELSFLGFMPGDRIFHQFVAKFPSFKGAWKTIYEFKYGLDKEAYESFQHLISITLPETPERRRVINLLAEWLCAYHEVLLIEIAKEEALKQGGILAYYDRNGKLTLEPENSQLFTNGKTNLALRNETHIMRELRRELIQHLTTSRKDKSSIPEFELVKLDSVIKALENLLSNESVLEKIASVKDRGRYKVQLTTEEEGIIFSGKTSEPQIRITKSQAVVNNLIRQGLFARPSCISYKKQITYLTDQEHLYTDLEINALLHQALDNLPNIDVYASQHPLIEGTLGQHCQKLFVDELKRIFQSNQTAVMPIEISRSELDEGAYLNIVGIHWNGLVISKIGNKSFRIELIDPALSPKNDINLSAMPANQINTFGDTAIKLLNLIQQAAGEINVTIHVHWLATQQQSSDLDCGPWTVDNLIRRAQGLALRTRSDITGSQLRQSHDAEYTSRLISNNNGR